MVDGESLVLGMSAQYHAGEQNIADVVLVIIPPQPMVGKIVQAVTPRLKDAMKIHAPLMVHGEIGQSGKNVLLAAVVATKEEQDHVIAQHHNSEVTIVRLMDHRLLTLKDAMKTHVLLMEHLVPGMIGLLALLSAEEEIKHERDDVIALHHSMAEKTVLAN
jgi:hypothetical protein